jgi:hypothetical protein
MSGYQGSGDENPEDEDHGDSPKPQDTLHDPP